MSNDVFDDVFNGTNGPAHDGLMFRIESKGFLTGSRAFGVESPASDWDYVLNNSIFRKVVDQARKRNLPIEPSDYNQGVKFLLNGKTINVFSVPFRELQVWIGATEAMKTLCSNDAFAANVRSDKVLRISVFEGLKVLVRITLSR